MLSDMGMEAFAERAHRELLATGATVRKRTVATLDELTPQEAQVARLAAGGQTNPEIGAQLFLSPRTVEWHLSKGVRKARDQLPQGAPRGAVRGRRSGRPPLAATGARAQRSKPGKAISATASHLEGHYGHLVRTPTQC
jgi:DNA-binding CsgD family transcriptional regulator